MSEDFKSAEALGLTAQQHDALQQLRNYLTTGTPRWTEGLNNA